MIRLFIDPSDVLLFRDGRSFSPAAGDQLARGRFPPPPTTVYGALRSALLSEHGADFEAYDFGLSGPTGEVVGTKSEAGSLALTRFALARRDGDAIERLYPVPGDVLVCKADEEKKPEGRRHAFLRPADDPPGGTNLPGGTGLLWIDDSSTAVYEPAGGYLPESAFRTVLSGDLEDVGSQIIRSEELFQDAPRTSVAIGEAGTGEDGMLFTVGFTRTETKVGFSAQLRGDEDLLPGQGWLRLGGEARSAHYDTGGTRGVPEETAGNVAERIRERRRFKLVLITPAAFEDGWRPDGIGEDGTGTVAGQPVRLTGAAVDRPVPLGGWDLAQGRPKQTRRAAPVGSVYFCELAEDADPDALVGKGPVLSISSTEADRRRGLGLAYLGAY